MLGLELTTYAAIVRQLYDVLIVLKWGTAKAAPKRRVSQHPEARVLMVINLWQLTLLIVAKKPYISNSFMYSLFLSVITLTWVS